MIGQQKSWTLHQKRQQQNIQKKFIKFKFDNYQAEKNPKINKIFQQQKKANSDTR